MQCPYCQQLDTSVLDSRMTSTNDSIRRRRECSGCNKRFTTYERIELVNISIVKKDGRSEMFDKNKLMHGILRACEKRPVKREKINKVVDEIEMQLRNMDRTEIQSRQVGSLVAEKLKELDEVAYVRFASVYRRFTDPSQFAQEVAKLKSTNNNKGVGKAKKASALG